MSRVSFWSSVVMPWTKTVYDGLTCIIHGLCIITMGSMACSDHSEAFMAVCPRIWKNRGRGLKFLLLPLQDRRCSERVSGCLLEKNLNIWKIKELGYKSVVLPFFFFLISNIENWVKAVFLIWKVSRDPLWLLPLFLKQLQILWGKNESRCTKFSLQYFLVKWFYGCIVRCSSWRVS